MGEFVRGVYARYQPGSMGMSSFMDRVRAGAGVATFPSACLCVITVSMKRQTVITKKRRGPLPTGKGTLIGVRLQPDHLTALDKWIERQPEPMTRPEALRAMLEAAVEIGLKGKK